MRRREFIRLLGGAAAVLPVVVRAQQPGTRVIGFLHVGSPDPFAHLVAALRQGLKESGFVEDQNLAIEFRWAEGQYDRLPDLAADLVHRQVALIVTGGGPPSAVAAKTATTSIPIVFNVGTDPTTIGLVTSLSRPGGNATGVNIFTTELEAKRVGLLHEMVPTGEVIAHIVNPNYVPTEANIKEVEVAAQRLGREILLVRATTENEIDIAFAALSQGRPGALLVGADPFFNSQRAKIVALVKRLAIPAIYEQREFAIAGGLISYGTSLTDACRQQGIYAGRTLKGENAGDLPILQSTKFELVINLKTAKAFGLTLRSGLLSIADEVIE